MKTLRYVGHQLKFCSQSESGRLYAGVCRQYNLARKEFRELTADQTALGGEFSFTREGDGTSMDAYICLGSIVYLFCNNIAKSMKEITQDPAWLDAQGEFLNASQHFAVDPLVL